MLNKPIKPTKKEKHMGMEKEGGNEDILGFCHSMRPLLNECFFMICQAQAQKVGIYDSRNIETRGKLTVCLN